MKIRNMSIAALDYSANKISEMMIVSIYIYLI